MLKKTPRKKISTRSKKTELTPLFKTAYFFALIIFLAVTVYVLFFSGFTRIKYLNLEGTREVRYEDVYAKAKTLVSGRYLNVLPRDNYLLVSKKRIQRELLNEFKKIRIVAVEKKFPDTINIKIEERNALIVWCAKGSCYIIDDYGFAYTGAVFDSDEIRENNLVKLVDVSAKPVAIGEQILDENYVRFIYSVREAFNNNLNIEIADEYITKYRISAEIIVKTNEGWDAYLNSRLPLEKSIRTIKTFLENDMDDESRKKLEYVDVRIENKVFYKLKNEENSENGKSLSENNADIGSDKGVVLMEEKVEKERKEKKKKKTN